MAGSGWLNKTQSWRRPLSQSVLGMRKFSLRDGRARGQEGRGRICCCPGTNPAFVLLQAALFLGLGVLFSLVSIPLVIYDWAYSSGSDEGH